MSYEGGGEGSISDIKIEMILSEELMDGRMIPVNCLWNLS